MIIDEAKYLGRFMIRFQILKTRLNYLQLMNVKKKTSDFKAVDLCNFIDAKFYEVTGLKKNINDPYIRSERSYQKDGELNLKKTHKDLILKV